MRLPAAHRNSGIRQRRMGSLALTLTVAVSSVSIVGYVSLSLMINALPPPLNNYDWVGLVQPAAEPQSDHVSLQVDVANEYIGSDSSIITYTVSACGPYPYSAELVFSSLKSAGSEYVTGLGPGESEDDKLPVRIGPPSLTLTAKGGSEWESLGSSQEVSVSLPRSSCSIALTSQNAKIIVTGLVSTSWWLQRSTGFWGLLHGPRYRLALPEVGYIGNYIGGALGDQGYAPELITLAGLHGRWMSSAQEDVQAIAEISDDWSMDSAVPAPSVAAPPIWSSRGGINPSAQFTDPSLAASLQDWTIIFAVGLGIGGSLLASLLFEWLRPHPKKHEDKPSKMTADQEFQSSAPAPEKGRSSGYNGTLAIIGGIFIVIYCTRRNKLRGRL
jgi:hypothetical protein